MSMSGQGAGGYSLVDRHANTAEYYEVAARLYETEEIYQSMVMLRREFDIPAKGYQTIEELENFKQKIRKESLATESDQDTDDEVDADFMQHLPEIKFERKVGELARLAKIPDSFKSYAELCVLCPHQPPDAIAFQRLGAVRQRTPLLAARGYRLRWTASHEPGVTVEFDRILTKDEWGKLRNEVDQMFCDDQADEKKPRVRKNAHADFLALRALREGGGSIYDAYDAVYDPGEIAVDKKKKDALRKRIKRAKQRGKSSRT